MLAERERTLGRCLVRQAKVDLGFVELVQARHSQCHCESVRTSSVKTVPSTGDQIHHERRNNGSVDFIITSHLLVKYRVMAGLAMAATRGIPWLRVAQLRADVNELLE